MALFQVLREELLEAVRKQQLKKPIVVGVITPYREQVTCIQETLKYVLGPELAREARLPLTDSPPSSFQQTVRLTGPTFSHDMQLSVMLFYRLPPGPLLLLRFWLSRSWLQQITHRTCNAFIWKLRVATLLSSSMRRELSLCNAECLLCYF